MLVNYGEKNMKTDKDQLAWEIQAYGMTKAQLDTMVKQQALGEEIMFAAGLLSDAQQILDAEFNTQGPEDGWVAPETANQARQYMNCAKAIMFDHLNKMRGYE